VIGRHRVVISYSFAQHQGFAHYPSCDSTKLPVVVLTALNVEYMAMSRHLTHLRLTRHPSGTLFTEGRLNGSQIPVVLAVTGEGNQATAILAERATARYAPRALLFVGVAGALKQTVAIGDVVIATRVYAYHGGMEDDAGFASRTRSWDASHPGT